MDCNLLTGGISKTCDNNSGSIRRMWLKEKSLIEGVAHGSPSRKISAITLASLDTFFQFEFLKKSGSNYTEVVTTSDTGSTVAVQTLTLVLTRREQAKRDILTKFKGGKEFSAIVEDGNGLFWFFGEYEGLVMNENTGGSGAQKADLNGYTITLVAEETEEACEISSTAVDNVIP